MGTRTDFLSSPTLVGRTLTNNQLPECTMVMSGGGAGDPRDDPDETKTDLIDVPIKPCESHFQKRTPSWVNLPKSHLDGAISQKETSECDFRRASMVEADLMKSAFDGADFRGADLRKARCNLSPRNCKLKGADLRGIRGKYAIWQGSDWWNAILNDDLAKAWRKNGPVQQIIQTIMNKNDRVLKLLKRQACRALMMGERQRQEKNADSASISKISAVS